MEAVRDERRSINDRCAIGRGRGLSTQPFEMRRGPLPVPVPKSRSLTSASTHRPTYSTRLANEVLTLVAQEGWLAEAAAESGTGRVEEGV